MYTTKIKSTLYRLLLIIMYLNFKYVIIFTYLMRLCVREKRGGVVLEHKMSHTVLCLTKVRETIRSRKVKRNSLTYRTHNENVLFFLLYRSSCFTMFFPY